MFDLANFAVKGCKGTDGCSGSQHTPCIQKKIIQYFSKDYVTSDNVYCTQPHRSRFVSFMFPIKETTMIRLCFELL